MKFFSLVALLLAGVPAFADVFTLDSAARGWFTDEGGDNGVSASNNYYAGIDHSFNSGDELRDWFEFDLSSVTGTVVSASLQIDTGTYLSGQSSETYQLTSLPDTFGFTDLGTGALFGSRVYTSLDSGITETIALDAAAIVDINDGGTFGLGGRLTSLVQSAPGALDEAIFSRVSGDPAQVELIVTTGTGPVAPEPASSLLFATGLAAIAGFWRRLRP